jgi:hypothetical protein
VLSRSVRSLLPQVRKPRVRKQGTARDHCRVSPSHPRRGY